MLIRLVTTKNGGQFHVLCYDPSISDKVCEAGPNPEFRNPIFEIINWDTLHDKAVELLAEHGGEIATFMRFVSLNTPQSVVIVTS